MSKPCLVLAEESPEELLDQAVKQLNVGPEAAKSTLDRLEKLEPSLSQPLRPKYFRVLLASYSFRGLYKEQVATSLKALTGTVDPNQRATFLYYLAEGNTNLGEYENALHAMNESIQLLPRLTEIEPKLEVLQSAVELLELLRAYDEAKVYARRLIDLSPDLNSVPACVGKADLVEISFFQHDSGHGREMAPDAIKTCDDGGHKVVSLDMKAMLVIDRLDNNADKRALPDGLVLLDEMKRVEQHSDYMVELADAIAKYYLKAAQYSSAESFGARAFQWANVGNAILLRQKTSETMAEVMRAEGKSDRAISYFDVSRDMWGKLLEERSRKDLAYQRVKFETQDKNNQIELLSRINALLTSERDLQIRNKQTLELLVAVSALLLVFVSLWLVRTWRLKNYFRTYSQIDGLTKISNRTHFISCAHQAFKDARGCISIVLFDMDEFKLINDTYSHAAGDWVLKTVSTTIAGCLRSQDMFGRLGGEEFAICLPHTSESDATALAERCRSAIESIDSSSSGHQFTLSASFGIAVRPPNGSAGFEEVLAAADRALYQAKHLGRNRIAPYGEVVGHAPLVA